MIKQFRLDPAAVFLILFFTAVLIYYKTFAFPFHFDDGFNIVENYKLRDLSNFWPPSGTRYMGYLSFALNYHFHQLDVFGYHLVNLSIHIVNGFFVWWLVLLTFKTPQMEGSDVSSRQKNFVALLSALIFISHPIQTQAVTYIVQRFTSLATFFYLLSLILYVHARLSFQVNSMRTWLYYVMSVICAILAMKTKEISFTLPIVVALYEFIFFKSAGSGFTASNLRRYYMLIPLLFTLLIIPLGLRGMDKGIGDLLGELREMAQETEKIPRFSYLLTQFRVIVTYLRFLVLPLNQNLDYDYPIYHSFTPTVFLSLLFILLIVGFALYLIYLSRVRNRELKLISIGIFWFFITLSVESSLIPIRDVINEHRLYLPSIGLIIAFSLITFLTFNYVKRKFSVLMTDYLLILMVVLPLSAATHNRNLVWGSDVTLWKDVVRKSPNKARGHYNLGHAYHQQGQLTDAIKEYKAALQFKPDHPGTHNNLGLAYYNQGRLEDAMMEYSTALQLKPDFPDAHLNLGLVYYNQRRVDEAIREYDIALQLKPDHPGVHNNLGLVYHQQGRLEEAIREYITAIRLQPDYPEAHNHLGLAYFQQGRLEEAIQEYKAAIKLKTDFSEARNNLGLVYHQQGRLEEAIQEYKTATRIKPQFAVAHYRLGLVYHQQERLEEAIQEYNTAIRIKPQFPEAYNNLGLVYSQQRRLEDAMQTYQVALNLNPNYLEAHYNLGNVYRLMGLPDAATKQFQIVLELRPDFVPAKKALDSLRVESHRMKQKSD
jgi:tetratricopeptide (TPR) repeat protein